MYGRRVEDRMPYAEGRVMPTPTRTVVETPGLARAVSDPDIRGQLTPLFVAAVKPGEETPSISYAGALRIPRNGRRPRRDHARKD